MCSNPLCFLPLPRLQVDFAVIASQAGATLNNLLSHAQELVAKLRSLQLDQREFVCLKFLVLFSLGECRRVWVGMSELTLKKLKWVFDSEGYPG